MLSSSRANKAALMQFVKLFLVAGASFVVSFAMLRANNDDRAVTQIEVIGNRKISEKAVLARLAFKAGDTLTKVRQASSQSLKNLSTSGYFLDDTLAIELEDKAGATKIIVKVEEKPLLSGYEFSGNSNVSTKKIVAATNLDKMVAIDNDDVTRIEKKIARMYSKENYFSVKVDSVLEKDGDESVKLTIKIEEGTKTRVQKINFLGCNKLPEHILRAAIQTREDWLFAAIDNAGKFDQDAVNRDKKIIEQVYKEHGFLQAAVSEVRIKKAENNADLEIVFCIDEGSQYTVSKVRVPYDDEFDALTIEKAITLKEGKPCRLSDLRSTMLRLESVFGEKGYMFINVSPDTVPDHDKKTVAVNFVVDKGEKYTINQIDITGNSVTKDFVIRRELLVQEGCLANKTLMEISRERVEFLDFFERGSVEWKVHKIDAGKVNLELVVQEKRTRGMAQMGINYSPNSGGKSSVSLDFGIRKRNLMGYGIDASSALQVRENRISHAHVDVDNPYLFDKNLRFNWSAYTDNADFDYVDSEENTIGTRASLGFGSKLWGQQLQFVADVGVEAIDYNLPKQGFLASNDVFNQYKKDLFTGSSIVSLGGRVSLNHLNYRENPTQGWLLELRNRVGLSGKGLLSKNVVDPNSGITGHSFVKCELEGRFYWPLVMPDKLVFSVVSTLGFVEALGDSRHNAIMHRELYKVGGIYSVRGFKSVESVGPVFDTGYGYPMPIGSKRKWVTNFELSAPLNSSPTSPIAYLFYDIGTGWNSQKLNLAASDVDRYIKSDGFDLRHSVGVGVKMMVPYPLRFDYGYKLNRRDGETPSELHFSMNIPLS